MVHTLSYSDFLKEGALQQRGQIEQEVTLAVKPFHIPAQEVPTETERTAFWKSLRHFFRTGERPEGSNGILVPAHIAPYLRSGSWQTEYPFYLAPAHEGAMPLEALLQNRVAQIFAAHEARILRQNLHRLRILFTGMMTPENAAVPFAEAKAYAFEKLSHLEVHDEEGTRFLADCTKLREALPDDGVLLDVSHEVPLFFIRQNLERIAANRAAYKETMQTRLAALYDVLQSDAEGVAGEAPGADQFAFAQAMIAMDKVQDMLPKSGRSKLSEARVQRIRALITVLEDALAEQENRAHLVVDESLKDAYRWQEIFSNSKVSFNRLKPAFAQVEERFDANINAFTQVLVAMRKAALELSGAYDEAVHTDYFRHFKWFKLTEDELALFPPVLLVTDGAQLLQQGMAHLSNLLVTNKPINILALTTRTSNTVNPNIDWEDASHGYRQELAAIAISHRGAHTLQCAADKPTSMHRGIQQAMNTAVPALMHLLVPGKGEDARVAFLKINAAATARFFPYVSYSCTQGSEWGSRFAIAENAQPEKDWAAYTLTYVEQDGQEVTQAFPFTYADYKAMHGNKVEELMCVPEGMVTDYLVPLHAYLALDATAQTGKVPFIWLVAEDNAMIRAAVPYMWAQSCQERLDFWNFIQELGGVNSYHVKLALAREKDQWEREKALEIAALQAEQQREVAQAKAAAAGEAMERLTEILLGNAHISAPKETKPITVAKPIEAPAEAPIPAEVVSEKPVAAPTPEAGVDPYVDTFRCTSCNDCTEKFPAIFMYNEEKQAEVKPDWQGTFEQLVMAAEGCPAACIHPGDPQNADEPNLEELKKRAAKFT